jgi:hypothetical protein
MAGPKTNTCLLAAAIVAVGTAAAAGSVEQSPDLSEAFPMESHFAPLPGLAVGVLIGNAEPILHAEKRFGPGDVVVFGRDDASYRWVYVPAGPMEAGETVFMLVGPSGERTQRFTDVVPATASTLRARTVPERFALVEAEVNGGLGSPPVDSFVATKLRVLDRTPEYPLDTARTVDTAVAQCRDRLADTDAVEQAFASAMHAEPPSVREGTRRETLTARVTWLPERERLRVECLFRVTSGEYRYGRGVARQGDQTVGDQSGIRYGRLVGITVTIAFEADKTGRIEAAGGTSPQPFTLDLPPPGGAFGPQRPDAQ